MKKVVTEEVEWSASTALVEVEHRLRNRMPEYVLLSFGEDTRYIHRLVIVLCGLWSGRGWWTQDFMRGVDWS